MLDRRADLDAVGNEPAGVRGSIYAVSFDRVTSASLHLKRLAVNRSDALYRIGTDTFRLVQSITNVLALHVAHHNLKMDISEIASKSEASAAPADSET